MTDPTKQPKRKRRWLRFSLRTFLIAVTFFGVVVGPYIYRAERQRAAMKWIEENNGEVAYAYEVDVNGSAVAGRQPFGPTWLHDILGVDYFSSVVEVDFFLWTGEDVKQLAGFKQLRRLRFWNDVFANPKQLASLTLVSDLTPLSGLTSLEHLDFSCTQVTDLTPLAGLASLKTLCLDISQVSDLTPLSGLTGLEFLNLESTPVVDLTPLTGLTSLGVLELGSTQVTELTPLGGLTSLEYLNLYDTPVTDLTPLADLRNLEYLDLRGTQVTDEEIKKLQQAIPNCSIVH